MTNTILTTTAGGIRPPLANDATVDNGTSYFTQHLVDGLLGAAPDQDQDGYVTFSDLYAYVDRRLRRIVGDGSPRRPGRLGHRRALAAEGP